MDLTEQKKSDLNVLLQSNGWVIVRSKIDEKLKELDSINTIDENATMELQVTQIKAQKLAKKIIQDVLNEILTLARIEKNIKKSML